MTTYIDIEALSREFCELTGICWHEINDPCLDVYCKKCRSSSAINPDFSDAREVIKVMRKRGELRQFLYTLAIAPYYFVKSDLIEDTTGLLLKEAVEFMRREG